MIQRKRPPVVTAAAISQTVVAAAVLFEWIYASWGSGSAAASLVSVFSVIPLLLSILAATGLWRGSAAGWWTATVFDLAEIVISVTEWVWWGSKSGDAYFRLSLEVGVFVLPLALLLLPPARRFYGIPRNPAELFSGMSEWAMSPKAWQYPAAFATGAAFDAVFFWRFQPYSMRGDFGQSVLPPWWSLPILAFTAGLILTRGRTHNRLLVPVSLVGGFFVANACLIVADCCHDPTNHNLWPFEFVMIAVLTAPAFLGAAFNALLQRRRKQ